MPLVSIVIPCYNAGNYLTESVASVRSQTFTDWEIIIVDDGSTDPETLCALAELEASGDLKIFRQSNAGPAAARNKAITEAKGTYILPLDADDTIEPTYLERGVHLLEQDLDLGIVYCKAMKFGCESGPWHLPPFSLEEMLVGNMIFCTALFRREDWGAAGGFPEQLRHGLEDYALWLKILQLGRKVHQIDEYLFNYRINKISRTTKLVSSRENFVATHAEIFRMNKEFFTDHIEVLFWHRFALEDMVRSGIFGVWLNAATFERCISAVKCLLAPCPPLYRLAKRIYRFYADHGKHPAIPEDTPQTSKEKNS